MDVADGYNDIGLYLVMVNRKAANAQLYKFTISLPIPIIIGTIGMHDYTKFQMFI
jgi:hypothetical protein